MGKISFEKDASSSSSVQQMKTQQQLKSDKGEMTDEEIKIFLKEYELKKLTMKDIYQIYYKNAMSEYFSRTLKSAFILIFAPAFTNLYYTFRPNSPLAGIMPFAMLFISLGQYFFVLHKDFEHFCFTNTEDAQQLRNKYKVLYAYSNQNKKMDNIVEDILKMEEKESKSKQVV